MDFLKTLFEGAENGLTYDALAEKAKNAGMKIIDLSGGGYVGKDKFDAKTGELNQTVQNLTAQITQRDKDLNTLKEQLTAAQTDAIKLKEAQDALAAAQAKYDADRQQWEADTAKRAYESAVKLSAAGVKFSSAAARKTFERDAIEAGLKLDKDGELLGFNDYVAKYRESDPGAFAVEEPPKPAVPFPPSIVAGINGGNGTAGANQNTLHLNFTKIRKTE